LQERLTRQVAGAISENSANGGVFVVAMAQHMCMTARGIMQPGAEVITRAMTGKFLSNKSLVLEAQQLMFGCREQKL
jgi:GTP cyclohydrolase I